MKRNEEEKPVSWEVSDPKLPVVRSGKTEGRVCRYGESDRNIQRLSG